MVDEQSAEKTFATKADWGITSLLSSEEPKMLQLVSKSNKSEAKTSGFANQLLV